MSVNKKSAEYRKEYQKQWHQRNRERRYAAECERRQGLCKWFQEYKATLACSRCGFTHPAALDFHHKDGREKDDAVSCLVARKMCKARIVAEIAKCEVLCSNCHRIEHYNAS